MKELLKKTGIPICSFINFPNHSMERFWKNCNNPLVKKIDNSVNNSIFRPIVTYLLVSIKQQLTLFFSHKDFEISYQKWVERKNETEVLFDIYMIYKTHTVC